MTPHPDGGKTAGTRTRLLLLLPSGKKTGALPDLPKLEKKLFSFCSLLKKIYSIPSKAVFRNYLLFTPLTSIWCGYSRTSKSNMKQSFMHLLRK